MEQEQSSDLPKDFTSYGGKAWTAYALLAIRGVLLLLIATPIAWAISPIAGGIALIGSILHIVYRFLYLKSFHLYADSNGIWVFSGVFPWNKGTNGVKWRDLDGAGYFQGMGSWLFKSYTIQIAHRFTKSGEILLSHWKSGDSVVLDINGKHQEMVRANSLN